MPRKGDHSRFGDVAVEWDPLPFVEEYLAELAGQLKALGYIRKVRTGLAMFSTFARAEGVRIPEDINRRMLLLWQAEVNGRPNWSQAYRQQQLKYLRGWIYWLSSAHRDRMPENPWYHIRVGTTPKKPKPLGDDELDLLFTAHKQQAFAIAPFPYHRRDVIITLLYAWGLRLHELQALNVQNMDARLSFVTAINKGGGTKQLPYPDLLKQVVMRWLQQRARYAKVGEDALLIDNTGDRLSIDRIRQIIMALAERAGIEMNPHRLRDTSATNMLDGDIEVERVMRLLGHSQLSQTLAYARVNDHKVKEAYEARFMPRVEELLSFKRTGDLPRDTPSSGAA